MTNEQFNALAQLVRRSTDSPSVQSARLVLVDGVSVSAAAAQMGVTRQAVNQVVVKFRKAHALAVSAATPTRAPPASPL